MTTWPAVWKTALHARQHLLAERAELRAAVVHGREVDGAQDPVGDVGRVRDLEKMASGSSGSSHASLKLHAKLSLCAA